MKTIKEQDTEYLDYVVVSIDDEMEYKHHVVAASLLKAVEKVQKVNKGVTIINAYLQN